MNGKQARKLRKQAQEMSTGLPLTNYERVSTGQILLKNCTRDIYQRLKRGTLVKRTVKI